MRALPRHLYAPQAISAMTLEHSGARLLTGSYDYNIKMWDFAGMDASLRSFRTTTPCGSHRVRRNDARPPTWAP